MPDKKLTDGEIVKALECCCTYKGKCTDCPAFVKVDRSNCKQVLLGAIEIINRLQADLIDKEKQLQKALKSMAVNKTKVIDCEREIDCQKSEIERLKPFEDKIAEFNSHIRVEDMLVFASSLEEWLEFCDNLKAEAYKEFAEKTNSIVDSLIEKYSIKDFEEFKAICQVLRGLKNDIDNLLKELVGD